MRSMSAASEDTSAPVVFYDAQVFTAEYDHPYGEAVAIRGDRIIAVGTLGSVERIAGPTSLDAFEAARKAVPESTLPFSLTHARFVDPRDIPRIRTTERDRRAA